MIESIVEFKYKLQNCNMKNIFFLNKLYPKSLRKVLMQKKIKVSDQLISYACEYFSWPFMNFWHLNI